MTTFDNGPARGKAMLLKRTPIYLRVVVGEKGKVDALDQIGDQPTASETLHAYRLSGSRGVCHINARGGAGGFWPSATYALVDLQPTDAVMRDITAWRAWCQEQEKKS